MSSRGVWQMTKMLIRYCPSSGASAGVRDFLKLSLNQFAKTNSHVAITASATPLRNPIVRARYLVDGDKELSLKNLSRHQVNTVLQRLRDSRPTKLKKWDPKLYRSPSVQGEWKPGISYDVPHRVTIVRWQGVENTKTKGY